MVPSLVFVHFFSFPLFRLIVSGTVTQKMAEPKADPKIQINVKTVEFEGLNQTARGLVDPIVEPMLQAKSLEHLQVAAEHSIDDLRSLEIFNDVNIHIRKAETAAPAEGDARTTDCNVLISVDEKKVRAASLFPLFSIFLSVFSF